MQKFITPFVVALLLVSAARGSAQTVTIIEASGDGQGQPLSGPRGLAISSSGQVYVAGAVSDNVFEISPDGAVREILDGSGDGAWNFLENPNGVAVDPAGIVYVSGSVSHNVFRVKPEGVKTAIIGAPGDRLGNPLEGPMDVALDVAGNVYVVGRTSNNVFRITPEGDITEIIDAAGDGRGNTLDGARGLTVDRDGNVYVSGSRSDNVFRITPWGAKTVILDASGAGQGQRLESPSAVAVDEAGSVYVAGAASDNVFRVTRAGVITEIIDGTGDGRGNPLDAPLDVALDSFGDVYVAGRNSDNAFRITPEGQKSLIIDSLGDGRGNPLDEPRNLAVDGVGNIYVSGDSSHNVFRIPPARSGLVDGSFERADPGARPQGFGVWGQDPSQSVPAELGITPLVGDRMLKFLAANPSGAQAGSTGCDLVQLVSLGDPATRPGSVTASAWFNRVDVDEETDSAFDLYVEAYEGDPRDFSGDGGLASNFSQLISDDDPATWEELRTTLEVPAGADYLAVWLVAGENEFNDAVDPEFDGHYADGVVLRDSSAFLEGPGEATFRRGDCNDDGAVDISDALFTLVALFLGLGDPSCDDACDSNDDGAVDISDPTATLGVLFLGTGSIPLPGMMSCGLDPTVDDLACEVSSTCHSVCDPASAGEDPPGERPGVEERLDDLLRRTEVPSALAGAFFRLVSAHGSGRAPANELESFAFEVLSDLSPPTRALISCATDQVSGLTDVEQTRIFGEVITFPDSQPLTESDLAAFVAEEVDQRLGQVASGERDLEVCLDAERPGLPRPARCFDIDQNFEGFCPQICRIDTPSLSRAIRTVGHVPELSAGQFEPYEVEQTCTFDAANQESCDYLVTPDCTGTWTDGVCLRVPVVERGDTIQLRGYNFFDVDALATLRSLPPLGVYREVEARVCGDQESPVDAPLDCNIEDILTFTVPEDLPEGLYHVGVSVPNNTGDPVYDHPWYSADGPVIRVVPTETSSFELELKDLLVRRTTADWGSDELGLRVVTVPIARDGTVGEMRVVKFDHIGSLDDGDIRNLDRVLYSGRVDAGIGLSIVGFEIDDQDIYEAGITEFIDAYGQIVESNWSKVADSLGEILGAGTAAAGYAEYSKVASRVGAEGIKILLALRASSELVIEDGEGLPFVRLAELTSLNFPVPPVIRRTSEGGVDILVSPCQDFPAVDDPVCSESAKAPFQYTEKRAYWSEDHGSNYQLTLRYKRVR